MNTHADKTKESTGQSGASRASQREDVAGSAYQFIDRRTESTAQSELQKMADNSPQAEQTAQLREVADGEATKSIQRQESLEDEELLQGKFDAIQKQDMEEEELLQGKFDTLQKVEEDEELMQGKSNSIQKKKSMTQDFRTP